MGIDRTHLIIGCRVTDAQEGHSELLKLLKRWMTCFIERKFLQIGRKFKQIIIYENLRIIHGNLRSMKSYSTRALTLSRGSFKARATCVAGKPMPNN